MKNAQENAKSGVVIADSYIVDNAVIFNLDAEIIGMPLTTATVYDVGTVECSVVDFGESATYSQSICAPDPTFLNNMSISRAPTVAHAYVSSQLFQSGQTLQVIISPYQLNPDNQYPVICYGNITVVDNRVSSRAPPHAPQNLITGEFSIVTPQSIPIISFLTSINQIGTDLTVDSGAISIGSTGYYSIYIEVFCSWPLG